MGSLIRAANLWGYEDLVRELGGDPDPFLARFHIPPAAERGEDAFVPFRNAVLLFEATAHALGRPDFGLRLSQWQGLDMLGPIAVIARNASTVQDALDAIGRFLHIHGPALTFGQLDKTTTRVRYSYSMSELAPGDIIQAYELSIANGIRILRLLSGTDDVPVSIHLLHDQQGDRAAYLEILGADVRFRQDWCGLDVPRRVAERAIDNAHPQTRQIATAYLESRHAYRGALADHVAELIRRLLPTGSCSAETIADHLALHPRTLQRRLADEGIRYHDLVDDQRRTLAANYLADPGLYFTQIAGLLGYAEQSALNRSCRRWFNMTPRSYRARATTTLVVRN